MLRRCLPALVFSLIGCYAQDEPAPCTIAASGRVLTELRAEAVDLLFVIDNSRSMEPYQSALNRELPRLVRGLASGDHDGNPETPSFPPVSSLRVGFITTDMGQAGLGTFDDDIVRWGCPTGRFEHYGDDGELIDFAIGQDTPDHSTGLQCDFDGDGIPDILSPTQLPPFLTFEPGESEPAPAAVDAFVRRASCFGLPGIGGCGSEMPLESMLKALTPSTSPIRFFSIGGDGRDVGHGDDPRSNGPWMRADSVLGVVLLTDEDDCSSQDRRVFDWGAGAPFADPGNPMPGDPASPYAQGFQLAANTRCVRFTDALLDVQRFVDGLVALRDDPRRVVFTAIAGVPPDLVDDAEIGEGTDNLARVLDDPRMAYEVIPDADGVPFAEIRTACSACPDCPLDATQTTPARRIVDTAMRLEERGANVLVQSICEESFTGAVEHILSKLGVAIAPTCVALPITRGTDGLLPCHARTTLLPGEHCADLTDSGYEPEPLAISGGREVCRMRQLAVQFPAGIPTVESGSGFYFDDFSPAASRCGGSKLVSFRGGAALRRDAPTELECIVEGRPSTSRIDVGTACDANDWTSCAVDEAQHDQLVASYGIERRDARANPELLRCESRTATCQLTCSTDADCPVGTVCSDGDDRIDWNYFPRCVFAECN